MGSKISTHPPSGFRDFFREEASRRERLIQLISEVYRAHGFTPLETPALENLEILQGSGGEENEKLMFKVMKRGEKLAAALKSEDENQIADFGMRFDMTVPLSRVVAHYRGQIQLPWKVYHLGPVWRAERPQKGRFREFVQCDVDIVGAKSIAAELDVLQAVVSAIHSIGATGGFELRVNDRRLIQGLAHHAGLKDEKVNEMAILMDKKDKIAPSDLKAEIAELCGTMPRMIERVLENDFQLADAESLHSEAGHDLKNFIRDLNALQLPLSSVVFDPSLARGLGYYTGLVFELRHSSAGYALGGGGRYDQLIGRFAGQPIPACGFSIGFERLLLLLAESESQTETANSRLFVPVLSEDKRVHVMKICERLRAGGLSVDLYPDQRPLKSQMKFASDLGYQWVLILGEEELQTGKWKLKNFQTSEESLIEEQTLIAQLKNR